LITSLRATEMSEVLPFPIDVAMLATGAASSPPVAARARSSSRWAGVARSHRVRYVYGLDLHAQTHRS
jgi:hypothetical protein